MPTTTAELLQHLAVQYPGRHDGPRLLDWANLPRDDWPWAKQAADNWSALIGDGPASLALLRQALFDHPDDPVYRHALPNSADTRDLQRRLQLVLACCNTLTPEDRPYRFAQWLALIDDADSDDAFVAGVALFSNSWSRNERHSLDSQLARLADDVETIATVEESIDSAISLLEPLSQQSPPELPLPAPWQSDLEKLHRLLATLQTHDSHFEQHPDNGDIAADRSVAASNISAQAPALIDAIDMSMATHGGIDGASSLLLAAIDRIQRAMEERIDRNPAKVAAGLRQACWATKPKNYAPPFTCSIDITVPVETSDAENQ